MEQKKIVIIGGPNCGKSTYAVALGIPVFCTDPQSSVREHLNNVTYLPEGMDWSQGSDYVVNNWFPMSGPYVIEGVGVVRALRKLKDKSIPHPFDQIYYFTNRHPSAKFSIEHESMSRSVLTIWSEVALYYSNITKIYQW